MPRPPASGARTSKPTSGEGTRRYLTKTAALLAWLALLVTGCASDPMPAIRQTYEAGNYSEARDQLAALESERSGDAHVYALERAVAELASGNPSAGEQALRRARDRLDDLAGQSALDWLSAVLLDDRQLDYGGADYERVLVRALLAIANLMAGGGDADAYALQVLEHQQRMMEGYEHQGSKPKLRYKLVAFGSYLRGILNEENPSRVSVARECFEQVVELEPQCTVGNEALARVTGGRHSAKGNGVVHVIALVGRGPYRVESDEPTTAAALAIAQWIWAIHRERVTFPNITRVPIPALAYHRNNPSAVEVLVNGRLAGTTTVVTDVEQTARAEFDAMRNDIIARAVVRRAFKIGVTEGVKEVVNPRQRDRKPDPWADLAISLGGLLWTAVESADLRCWSLLPASFQVLRLELPAGEHEIELRAAGRGTGGRARRSRITVRDGFNTYVLGLLPTMHGEPALLASDAAEPVASSPPLTP